MKDKESLPNEEGFKVYPRMKGIESLPSNEEFESLLKNAGFKKSAQ
jgi:hypothetical protein